MKKTPVSVSDRNRRQNGGVAPSSSPQPHTGEDETLAPSYADGSAVVRGSPWLGAMAAIRSICVIGFALAAVVSFSSYGSHVYRNGALYEPFVLVLAGAAAVAAFAAWWRFNADKSSQSFLLFCALVSLAVLSAPQALLDTAGQDTAHLLFGPLSRAVFGIAVIAAVMGVQLPSLSRLPSWAAAGLVIALALAMDITIQLGVAEELYRSSPRTFLRRVEIVSLAASLFALLLANRVWWKTRRPFLIYVIGAVSALTLAGTLFLFSAQWEGRWWVAHLGLFASAVVVSEGVLAESARRGRLSAVMDLGGLSKLAEGTVDAMRDGLALYDAEGELVGWNPAAERITGWSRQMASRHLTDRLPEGTVGLDGGKWLDVRHFTVLQNGYRYQATLFTDVSERRRAEEALRESEERYRSLVEVSPDAVVLTDLEGTMSLCNRRAAALHGYESGEELFGRNFFDLVSPDDRERAMANAIRIVREGGIRDVEYRMVRRDGTHFSAELSASLIRDTAGKARMITAVVRDITERKRAQAAIQAASDEVRDLYNAAPCGYHSLDKNGVFVRINDTELDWLGYKRSELLGKRKLTDILTPSAAKAFNQSLAAFHRRGSMRGLEIEMVRKNGETFPALLGASAVKDADGNFVMTRSTVFDITERKRAEEEVRESEMRARSIINTAYDAFVAIDQSGVITDWNPQAQVTFGWSRKEAIGRKLSETIIPRRLRRLHKEGLARFLRTGKGPVLNRRIELTAMHKDGNEFPVELTISPVQVGDEFAFNAFIHDITERKQAEATRARLAAIVESSDDAIIGTSLDGTIASWNKGARRLYGYTSAEAVGKPITMLNPPGTEDEAPEARDGATLPQGIEHFETVQVRKDGSRVEVSLSTSPILDADGVVTGASTIARDVTARKRAEALARQTEELTRSNADLEQFAYVASHDLQEPLRMVTGYCDLLQRRYKGKLDADADDFITFAVEGAKRMQELVRGLLAYSRVGPAGGQKLEPVDATDAFDRAVANLSLAIQESGAALNHGPLPSVRADRLQLEHVFQNLIGNAIKFRGADVPRVEVEAVRQGEMWLFSVKDNGIGIDPRYAEKVFAIFQRLHSRGAYPGSGLGLAICKKIVERHGGRIWFESQPEHGTTFYFTLLAGEEVMDNER